MSLLSTSSWTCISDSEESSNERRDSFVPVDEDDEERMLAEAMRLSSDSTKPFTR